MTAAAALPASTRHTRRYREHVPCMRVVKQPICVTIEVVLVTFDDAAPVARKGMWRQVISSMFCMIDASGARIVSLAADLRYMPWANALSV